jgi:hypothetical protein
MEVSFEESDINSEQSLIMDNHGKLLSNIDVLDTESDAGADSVDSAPIRDSSRTSGRY